MKFIFKWISLSVLVFIIFSIIEKKDYGEIFIASLFIGLIVIMFFSIIFKLIDITENVENSFKKLNKKEKNLFLSGILIGIGLGWLLGKDE